MRCFAILLVMLSATPSFAVYTHLLTEIRLSWPLDQAGNPFRLATSDNAFLEFETSAVPSWSLKFDVPAGFSDNVAALVADLTDGEPDTLTMTVGSFSISRPEPWAFGDFDFADGSGLRRLDYVTRDFTAQATGVDWRSFQLTHFHVSAIGPISSRLPDSARVVIEVWGSVPEPSTAMLFLVGVLSTAAQLRTRHCY